MLKTTSLPAAKAAAYECVILENNLTVLVHPMPGFTGVHAVYGTRFGSADRCFCMDGKQYCMPSGIAHFLEHKMFENEQGDAFTLYAKTGASANAYTSFDKTCYIFTAASRIPENLDILLGFVSHPHFTKETIAKEQGIIGQEIKMYDDAPDWRLMFSAYQCLYHSHAVREDIAGSVESIAQITPELLYACTDAFYRPENMVLSVAGNVSMEEVLAACARADIPAKAGVVERVEMPEPKSVRQREMTFSMPVAKPLLGLAFKEKPLSGAPLVILKGEIICDMLTELICGSMTPLYRRLYDEGLVSPGFSGEFLNLPGATSILFGGETNEPETVRALLLEEILRLRHSGVDAQLFTLCKNLMYGEMVQDLESVDDVAAGMAGAFFKGRTPAQEMETLAALTVNDVNAALQTMLCEEVSATVIIRP
ncbi:MAG: pitrilysin family protein, partial [Ruthenibacterium sp.]